MDVLILVVSAFFVLLVGGGIVQYGRKMMRMRVDRWREFAERQKLGYQNSGLGRLGEIGGISRGRWVSITAVSSQTGEFSRTNVAGSKIQVKLCESLYPLCFRAEKPLDRLPVVGTAEVEIGDAELDPLLRLMQADQERYRELLIQPEVRSRILRAFEAYGVLSVEGSSLTLARPGQDPALLSQLLDEALSLADALEQGDGQGWRVAAESFDLSLTQGPARWRMERVGGEPCIEMDYLCTGRPRTQARLQLNAYLRNLQVGPRDLERPGIRTGDPILDAHVRIEGLTRPQLMKFIGEEGSTESLLNLVKGMGGRIEAGWIILEKAGLIGQPGDVLADMLGLMEVLETHLVLGTEG